jgi:transcriptional regulator with XRE-family HTH domain
MSADVEVSVFIKAVRRRRMAMGLTVKRLADQTKLSQQYVSSLEQGQRNPSLRVALALAKALGAELGDLLGGREASPLGREAARLIDQMPEPHREPALLLLRALSSKRIKGRE